MAASPYTRIHAIALGAAVAVGLGLGIAAHQRAQDLSDTLRTAQSLRPTAWQVMETTPPVPTGWTQPQPALLRPAHPAAFVSEAACRLVADTIAAHTVCMPIQLTPVQAIGHLNAHYPSLPIDGAKSATIGPATEEGCNALTHIHLTPTLCRAATIHPTGSLSQ